MATRTFFYAAVSIIKQLQHPSTFSARRQPGPSSLALHDGPGDHKVDLLTLHGPQPERVAFLPAGVVAVQWYEDAARGPEVGPSIRRLATRSISYVTHIATARQKQ